MRRQCHVHPEQVTDLVCVTSGSRTRYRESAATKCRVDWLERGRCCWRMDWPGRLGWRKNERRGRRGARPRGGRSRRCPAHPFIWATRWELQLDNSTKHKAVNSNFGHRTLNLTATRAEGATWPPSRSSFHSGLPLHSIGQRIIGGLLRVIMSSCR